MKHRLFLKWLDSPSHTMVDRIWWFLYRAWPPRSRVRGVDRDRTPVIDLRPGGRRG